MADSGMFGAPIGIAAAEDQINQNIRAGLLAQKTLGEISQQPLDAVLKQAHARLYGAEAAQKEAALKDQQTMDRLAEIAAANRRAQAQGRTEGTAEDLDAVRNPQSLADPFVEMLRLAQDAGAPPRLTLDLAGKTSTILQREATANAQQALQQERQIKAASERAARVASMAQAALDNPQMYDQILAAAASEGFPVDRMPATFNEGTLKSLRDLGLSTKDKMELKLKETEEERKKKKDKVDAGRATASIALNEARTKLVTERYNQLKKEGGVNAESVREARNNVARAREATAFAKLDAKYPMAPADAKSWEAGKVYRLPNGSFVRAAEVNGVKGGIPVSVPDSVRSLLFNQKNLSAAGVGGAVDDEDNLDDED